MNRTASQTTITISTTDASANKTAIRRRLEYDNRTGQPRIIEKVRGIRV